MLKNHKPLGDLIRREDAAKILCRATCTPGVLCPDEFCVEIREKLDAAPAVDAVEVIRCRDCLFWSQGTGICNVKAWGLRQEDDYCSSGVRRDAIREPPAKILKSPGLYGGYRCGVCGKAIDKTDRFCRWCGVGFTDD